MGTKILAEDFCQTGRDREIDSADEGQRWPREKNQGRPSGPEAEVVEPLLLTFRRKRQLSPECWLLPAFQQISCQTSKTLPSQF